VKFWFRAIAIDADSIAAKITKVIRQSFMRRILPRLRSTKQ
jgi:hypothetical protein